MTHAQHQKRLLAAELVFRLNGNAEPHLAERWSFPEPHHTWGVGASRVVRVPIGRGEGRLMLEMAVVPMVAPREWRRIWRFFGVTLSRSWRAGSICS